MSSSVGIVQPKESDSDVSGGKLLGVGAFGAVFTHFDKKSQQIQAVKKIKISSTGDSDYEEKIRKARKEVETMEQLEHERIVQFIRHEIPKDSDGSRLCIYMEYMPGGSLNKRLESGAFPEKETKRCMTQILEGLSYLHSKHLMHRDVKGSNILIDAQDNLKLSDFGVSKPFKPAISYSGTVDTRTRSIGTPKWMAPEVVNSTDYSREADIWSVGATMVEMLTQQPPWPKHSKIQWMFQISQKAEPQYNLPPTISETAKNMLKKIFNYSHEARPTAEKLLGHPWFIEKSPEMSLDSIAQEKKVVLPPHPNSIEPLDEQTIPSGCIAVDTYGGIGYVGCESGVYRISLSSKQLFPETSPFIPSKNGRVISISVYCDRIYTFFIDSTVNVYDLKGNIVTSWTHRHKSNLLNQLAVIDSLVVIPDLQSKALVFYSLNGEVVCILFCPLLNNSLTRICAANSNSFIVSHEHLSLVFKFSTSQGKVIWKCKEVVQPVGMTCYQDDFVFVIDSNGYTLCIISLETGQVLSRLAYGGDSFVHDMAVFESTLVILGYWSERVKFYQIK